MSIVARKRSSPPAGLKTLSRARRRRTATRRARFGGWLSGTVSGRPACEQSPRAIKGAQFKRAAMPDLAPRPDQTGQCVQE